MVSAVFSEKSYASQLPESPSWIFGYGSLIWKVDFPVLAQQPACIYGWNRRFWQGSHDHRGLPHAPGRVVTLIPEADACCHGMAYQVEPEVFEHLDFREKNGYERHRVSLHFKDGQVNEGLVYIAAQNNHAFLGPADMLTMARQIRISKGPSGSNSDYLRHLAEALDAMQAEDVHVSELHEALLKLEQIEHAEKSEGSGRPTRSNPHKPEG